jgi:hypothetical protein
LTSRSKPGDVGDVGVTGQSEDGGGA